MLTPVSKISSVDQSELEKYVVSHCQTYYILIIKRISQVNKINFYYFVCMEKERF